MSAPELQHKRRQVINYLKHNDTLGMRGDYKYKELIELCIYYLEGVCDEVYDEASKKAGAIHRARWLSKISYCIKIDLLLTAI